MIQNSSKPIHIVKQFQNSWTYHIHSCPMWTATISRHPPARCLGFYYFCNLMPCPKCTRFYAKAPAGLWIDCLLQLLKSSSHFSTIDYAEWCARTQPFKVALALPNRFLSLINISKIALIFPHCKYSGIWGAALSPTSVVLTDRKRTVHFWAALHFYSIANFVASWLKWLQMISNDSKWLQLTY